MSKFLRIGQELTKIYIDNRNIEEYNIVVHSAGDLRSPGIMPATTEKAAKVFQQYIALLTDITLPIIYDIYPLHTEKEIAIGGVFREYDTTRGEAYEEDEYEIKTVDGNLIINGGVRGILYGVYTFLEKYLGVRFFSATCERVLYQEKVQISDIDERFNPPFEYRDLCHWNIFDVDFSVKSKINGTFVRKLREEDGYGVGFAGGFAGLVHTYSLFCSPQTYFYEHPEYFSLDREGHRSPASLCYSNAEMQKVVTKNILQMLKKEVAPKLVSLSINDVEHSDCHCEKCKGLFGGKGNNTDRMLYFVNKVARRVKKVYPAVKIDTISYADVKQPPEIVKPADNVIIRVCASKDIAGLTLEQGVAAKLPQPMNYMKRINELSAITDKIYIWDYPYDYVTTNAIFPILHTLREDMRYYVDHSVKGIFINGQTDASDFDDLKIYLLAKVMFDPYMSAEEYERHMTEFLEGYYGAGWKELYRFILMSEKASAKKQFDRWSPPQKVIPLKYDKDGNVDYTFMNKAWALFNKAKAKARGGEWRRIDKNSLQVDYYELRSLMKESMKKADEAEQQEWAKKNETLYRKFIKYGIKRIVENVFVPVVKNFKQSPIEWEYWDFDCVTGDRNNESYERELYLLVPVEAEEHTFVDIAFAYKTNNENARGYVSVYGSDSEKINATWDEYGEYQMLQFKHAEVLSRKSFSEISGIDETDKRLNLLPIHLKGAILKVEKMDAGAYAFVKDIKVLE
jgi:hypothetical protein